MLKELYDAIKKDSSKVNIVVVDDTTYSSEKLHEVKQDDGIYCPEVMTVQTLTGIVDYFGLDEKFTNEDYEDYKISKEDLFLHIQSPSRVVVRSKVRKGVNSFRLNPVMASYNAPEMGFGAARDQVGFRSWLMNCFVIGEPSDNVEDIYKILDITSRLIKSDDFESVDSGVGQTVSARQESGLPAGMEIKNPYKLRPHRTFPEIEQPESAFILRIFNHDKISLIETDNGAWKVKAVESIKEFFHEKLKGVPVIA